jgi:hypothetical protein
LLAVKRFAKKYWRRRPDFEPGIGGFADFVILVMVMVFLAF